MEALACCRSDLKKMEVDMGTPEEVQKKARWYARYNKATMVQYFTQEEFARRHEEVVASLQKFADEHRAHILQWAARGELTTEFVKSKDSLFHDDSVIQQNIVRAIKTRRSWPPYSMSRSYRIWANEHRDGRIPAVECQVTGAKSSIFVMANPETAQALASVLGVEVNDLPDVMQQYTRKDIYSGNHLLSNIDPMDWCVENPWNEMGIQIIVGFSVRGYKKMRKDMGLETEMDTIKEEER
jgi:hypothetical protein